jgi:hypothetical protein
MSNHISKSFDVAEVKKTVISKSQFKTLFELPFGDFDEPVEFSDDSFGFSVIKNYKNNYQYASLFKVYINKRELENKDNLLMVEFSVSYGKKSDDGIILSSSREKIKGMRDPIDLISTNEFFYNISSKKFSYKNKEISAKDALLEVDYLHLKPTKPIGGFWLRTKIFFTYKIIANFWNISFKLLAVLQYFISGEKIRIFHQDIKESNKYYRETRSNNELDKKQSDLIDLWGYKIKPWIAGIYAVLHLILYYILYYIGYRPVWLITIFKNSFLTSMYAIVSIGLANTLLPMFSSRFDLKQYLKMIQSQYMKSIFKKIKI